MHGNEWTKAMDEIWLYFDDVKVRHLEPRGLAGWFDVFLRVLGGVWHVLLW